MIEAKNLTKRFKKGVTAVDSINFKANDGEILGLLGENGCLLYTSPSPRDTR